MALSAVDQREMQLIAAANKRPTRTKDVQWPDPYARTSPDGAELPEGHHWTGETQIAPKEYGGGKAYVAEEDAPGALSPKGGKYPHDFVRLYNGFLNDYVKRPDDVAKEREAGSGPLTDRMSELDDIKGTMDWIRGEGKPLAKLPLAAQHYIYNSPDFQEWQAQQPFDRQSRTMGREQDEPAQQPPNPQADDIDRLFAYRAWGRNYGPNDKGGAPTPEWGL